MGSSTAGSWAVCPAVVGGDVLHPASWSGLSVDADLMHSETNSEDNSIQCKMQSLHKKYRYLQFRLAEGCGEGTSPRPPLLRLLSSFHRDSFNLRYGRRSMMRHVSFVCPLCCSGRCCDYCWPRGSTLLCRSHLPSPLSGDELEDVRILCFVVRQGEDGLTSFAGSRTLASGSSRGVLYGLEYRPVNVVGPGAGLGGRGEATRTLLPGHGHYTETQNEG